jgi:nucleotide-binding universal stress UspA family protein
MTFTSFLVPIALSPGCAWAARYSAQLARRFGSELRFIHVGNCQRETVEAFLQANLEDTPHEITIRQGDPAETIVQLARETSPSLIVMPTHAHGRFRRFLLGSVTAKVLHDVDCPVLTGVHRQDVPLPMRADFRRIVCGVDTDQAFAPVIRGAIEFGSLANAPLTVVQ